MQFYTFMQIVSCWPHWIKSENYSTCSNYRCCVIVCTRLHWFQSSQGWQTFDYIHASLIPECTVLHFYANNFMAAIFLHQKIVRSASASGVVWLFPLDFIDSSQARAEKLLITHMHFPYQHAEFCTSMQIASWRPHLIKSKNCWSYSNYGCCLIV